MNDRDYCEESMDKLLILLLVKHEKWGTWYKKGAEMPIFGIRLPYCAHKSTVKYEQAARTFLESVSNIIEESPLCSNKLVTP